MAVALLQDPDMYLDVLADGCAIIAWLVHFGAMVVLKQSAYRCTRGPPVLVVSVLLLLPNLVITLTAYAQNSDYLDLLQALRVVRLGLAVARATVLLLYLSAFAAPCIQALRDPLSINASSTDLSPLLPRPVSAGEMVAEDGSDCLSRLLYLWLNPLLRQGERAVPKMCR